MSWLNHETAAQWRQAGKRYAADVNEFVRIGMESQWQQEQPEPKQDERPKLAKDIFRMIQEANQAGEVEKLRQEIPAASWPLTPAFEEALQAVRPVAFMNGGNEVVQAPAIRIMPYFPKMVWMSGQCLSFLQRCHHSGVDCRSGAGSCSE